MCIRYPGKLYIFVVYIAAILLCDKTIDSKTLHGSPMDYFKSLQSGEHPQKLLHKSLITSQNDDVTIPRDMSDVLASLTSSHIRHPALTAVLPILQGLLSGKSMTNVMEATGNAVETSGENNFDAVHTLRAFATKSIHRHSALLFFNMSAIQSTDSRIVLFSRTQPETTDNQLTQQRFCITVTLFDHKSRKLHVARFTHRKQRGNKRSNMSIDLSVFAPYLGETEGGYFMQVSVKLRQKKYNMDESLLQFLRPIGNVNSIINKVSLLIFSKSGRSFVQSQVQAISEKQRPTSQEHPLNILKSADSYHVTKLTNQNTIAKTRHRRQNDSLLRHNCNKRDFIVDFKTLGWDRWIIYPKTYNTFNCQGKCRSSFRSLFEPTNHALLMSLMRLSDRSLPRPCCAPTKMSALSMLYFENEELVVRQHTDMVVDQCACQ